MVGEQGGVVTTRRIGRARMGHMSTCSCRPSASAAASRWVSARRSPSPPSTAAAAAGAEKDEAAAALAAVAA